MFGGLVLVGYLAFEVYTINQARYQMEGSYIFSQFVTAARANDVCRHSKSLQHEQFLQNLQSIRQRAIRELSLANADANAQEIEQMISEQVINSQRNADEVINTKGCDDIEAWKLLRRFDNYAKMTLHTFATSE